MGWALADEVLFALPDPLPFLQRLHRMGFDSFFLFLKNCRSFSILYNKMGIHGKKQLGKKGSEIKSRIN